MAINHYTELTTKHNESCVESCDKAIELILKARISDLGESIEVVTKRGTRTVYIREALNILENKKRIKIPENKKLVKIHELRNPTHHRGETVSRARTKSVLKITHKFIERFLKHEFNIKLTDIVKPEYYEVLERNISKTGQIIKFAGKAEIKTYSIHEARPGVLKDYRSIEDELNRLAKMLNLGRPGRQLSKDKPFSLSEIVNILISNKKLPRKTRGYFNRINTLRDKVVNRRQEQIKVKEYERFSLAVLRLKVYLEMISHSARIGVLQRSSGNGA